jgi:hypothetical protein
MLLTYSFFIGLYYSSLIADSATQVRLSEPESSVIIARESGDVLAIALNEGDTVVKGSLILVMKNTFGTSELITNSAGLVKHIGPQVVINEAINPGDFIVEIEEQLLKGMLYFDDRKISAPVLELKRNYCCLRVGELVLTIDITNFYSQKGAKIYFFTMPLESSELKKIVKDGKLSEQLVSFSIQRSAQKTVAKQPEN